MDTRDIIPSIPPIPPILLWGFVNLDLRLRRCSRNAVLGLSSTQKGRRFQVPSYERKTRWRLESNYEVHVLHSGYNDSVECHANPYLLRQRKFIGVGRLLIYLHINRVNSSISPNKAKSARTGNSGKPLDSSRTSYGWYKIICESLMSACTLHAANGGDLQVKDATFLGTRNLYCSSTYYIPILQPITVRLFKRNFQYLEGTISWDFSHNLHCTVSEVSVEFHIQFLWKPYYAKVSN